MIDTSARPRPALPPPIKILIDEDGLPLNVGRSQRTATPAQWKALEAIYTSCALCDRPLSWCQAHHLIEWIPTREMRQQGHAGGPTDLDNLVPLCSHHHHVVHEGGWSVKLLPDRTVELYCADGTLAQVCTPDRLYGLPAASEHERRAGYI